jgi:UDP-N-acetyl-D-mannosaminuronic acid dehydrogenase
MIKYARTMVVVGLGRVGLPFGIYFARKGWLVYGIDKNSDLVAQYREGKIPFQVGFPHSQFRALLKEHFIPGADYARVKKASYIIFAVGAPTEHNQDWHHVKSALKSTLPFLKSGQTIIIRSTVPPGTIKALRTLIERNTPFKIGSDIFLAYCPERALEGKVIEELPRIPQLIGADDSGSRKKAAALFRFTSKKLLFSNSVSAELAKIFSNIHRYVDFAIANACMMIVDRLGQDIHEIVHLVNKGYSRGLLKFPGLTGGPCLPKSPFLLPRVAGASHFLESAHQVHQDIPKFLIQVIKKIKGENLRGLKVAMLGIAFKGDSDNVRGSVVLKLNRLFENEGCHVFVHDPLVFPANDFKKVLHGADIVVIGAPHSFYSKLTSGKLRRLTEKSTVVCDPSDLLRNKRFVYEV